MFNRVNMNMTALTPVRVRIERRTTLPCTAERAWAWFADIPASVHCFPQVTSCEPVVDPRNALVTGWRVCMRPRPVGARLVQTVYACVYTLDRAAGVVEWHPMDQHLAPTATARMSGRWALEIAKAAAQATAAPIPARLTIEGEIGLPIPAFATTIAAPRVQTEFDAMADAYVQRVRQALAAAD